MKTKTQHLPSYSRVGNTRIVGHDHADCGSLKETRALLSTSLAARNARLAANDVVSTDEAAELKVRLFDDLMRLEHCARVSELKVA